MQPRENGRFRTKLIGSDIARRESRRRNNERFALRDPKDSEVEYRRRCPDVARLPQQTRLHAFTIPSQTDQHAVRGDVGGEAMTSLIVMRVGARNTGKVETLQLL